MKRYISVSVVLILLLIATGCSSTDSSGQIDSESGKATVEQIDIQATVEARVNKELGITPEVTETKQSSNIQSNADAQANMDSNVTSDIGLAQRLYPPMTTNDLLQRRIPWPTNFDRCFYSFCSRIRKKRFI